MQNSLLPKVDVVVTEIELPSGKKIEIRPFLVKEEKLLFTALETDNRKSIIETIKTVMNNCIETDGVKAEDLMVYDFEYLFLQLRLISISDTVKLGFRHSEKHATTCDEITEINIDLNHIKVIQPEEKVDSFIRVNKTGGFILRHPTFADSLSLVEVNDNDDNIVSRSFEKIADFIETIVIDDETAVSAKEISRVELIDWISTFNKEIMEQIASYMNNVPKLRYDLEYTCRACGQKETYRLEGLFDFFM